MARKRKIFVFAFVLLALSAATTNATIVTIGIAGEITYVGRGEWLNENFKIGDIITGRYTYNTDTPDLFPSNPRSGVYWHYSEPYGISLRAGDFVFQTDPGNVQFLIGIYNRDIDGDNYLSASYRNLPLSNGILVNTISWQLDDLSGQALCDDMLPTSAPVLEDWQSIYGLVVTFGDKGGFGFRATVTTAYLIPEPATFSLLMLGGIFFLRKGQIIKY